MRDMRKMTEMSLHRNKEKRDAVYEAFEHEQLQEKELKKRLEREYGEGISKVGPTSRVQNRSALAPTWLDKMEAEAEDMEMHENFVDSDGEAESTNKSISTDDEARVGNKKAVEREVHPEKPRLSIAERRKLKKNGVSGRAMGIEANKKAPRVS